MNICVWLWLGGARGECMCVVFGMWEVCVFVVECGFCLGLIVDIFGVGIKGWYGLFDMGIARLF